MWQGELRVLRKSLNYLNITIKQKIVGSIKCGLLLFIVALLSSCMNAAVTGAQLVYDRHDIYKDVGNFVVKVKADSVLAKARQHRRDIKLAVASFNHDLLLVGQVPTEEDKERIGHALLTVPGHRRVFNQLEIKPPIGLTQKLKDTWITTKIKAAIIANSDIDPEDFKVVTEDDIVYLLGDVKKEESEKVVHIARHTAGVRYVVRMFRYYTYKKLERVNHKLG